MAETASKLQQLAARSDWGPDSDRELLAAMQSLSDEVTDRVSTLHAKLNDLGRKSAATSSRVQCLSNKLHMLAQTQPVEQRVGDTDLLIETPVLPALPPAEPRHTPEQQAQIVVPKFKQALDIGSTALLQPPASKAYQSRRLPFLYGSPEYLQDAEAGLGPVPAGPSPPAHPAAVRAPAGTGLARQSVGWQRSPGSSATAAATAAWAASASEACMLAGGEPDALSDSMEDEPDGVRHPADFKSMLEAALRGETAVPGASPAMSDSGSSSGGSGPGGSPTGPAQADIEEVARQLRGAGLLTDRSQLKHAAFATFAEQGGRAGGDLPFQLPATVGGLFDDDDEDRASV